MKKVFMFIAVAVVTLTASAQVYVGGETSFWREWKNGVNKTSFSVMPEIGYNLDGNWAIGTTVGYQYQYQKGDKINAFKVAPYARYTYAKLGSVNLFLDGGFGFATYKIKNNGVTGDAQNAWEVGIKPGVSVNLTEKLSFIAHVGFLGYREADDEPVLGENGLGFNLDGNALSFGLYYNF